MPRARYALIAREGWIFILAEAVLTVTVFYYFGLLPALLPLALLIWLILLFRDPLRAIPSAPLAVVSPVDGRVFAVENTQDPALKREAIRIAVRINHLGAYIARSPVEGKLLDVPEQAQDGKRRALRLTTDEGDDVVLLIHGRRWLGKPRAFPRYGERLGQGQRFAYLRFAALAEVFVPANSRVQVKVGDYVTAATDPIATLIHD